MDVDAKLDTNLDKNLDVIGRCFFLADAEAKAEAKAEASEATGRQMDVAIVLGMNDWERPAARAIALYRAGAVGKLLFTGGHNDRIGACEAQEMADFARREKVPQADILIEPKALHTEENFRFARAILDAEFGPDALRSVVLVTIHYHLRRAIIAARRHFSPPVAIGWASYPSLHYSAADWHVSPRGRADIASEIAKIEKYYAMSLSDLAGQRP